MPTDSSPASSARPEGELRRALGAFYTPSQAVDLMVSCVTDLKARTSILEPSGGDGAFVEGLLRADVPASDITVWDVNEHVREPLEALGVHVSIHDSLLHDGSETFDLIIGNPPYLSKASDYIRANRDQLRRRYEAIGASEAYAMFIAMSMRRLTPGGQMLLLVSDTFLTLGIHRRLRALMLEHARLDQVLLLPRDTFADAAVSTAVIILTNAATPAGHDVEFRDLRASTVTHLAGPSIRVPHDELSAHAGLEFAFTPEDRTALRLCADNPPLMDFLDGGLGMFTKDNARFLTRLPSPDVDWTVSRPYHKRGGQQRWFAPVDSAVDWSDDSRAGYGIPDSALSGADENGQPRRGFILSGVSSRLAARTMVRSAMWESNKAFGLFPKDPDTYPVEFFLAILNSGLYSRLAQALNHTVSLQVRDLQRLPMLAFTPGEVAELAALGLYSAAFVRDGGSGEPVYQARIDEIVEAAASR